jgi:hypothetical protein
MKVIPPQASQVGRGGGGGGGGGARDEEIARVRLLAPVRRSMVAFHRRASQVIDFAGDFCWLMGIWAQKSRRGAARHGGCTRTTYADHIAPGGHWRRATGMRGDGDDAGRGQASGRPVAGQ